MALAEEQVEQLVLLLIVSLVVALIARQFRFPYTLALVLVGLALGRIPIVSGVHLNPEVVLFIFIPVLLFEGSWNVSVTVLLKNWLPVLLLAVPGLLIALAVAASALHFGAGLTWLEALLLGAIISPTDPVAVVSLFRQLRMGERLRTIIEGESLFNDGIGAAAYTIVLGLLLIEEGRSAQSIAGWQVGVETVWLVIGGPLIGLAFGFLISRLLRHFDDHLIEMTITFSAAYGVYLVGDLLHTSGLLAVVMTGLTLGSYGRQRSMSERTRDVVDDVWEFISYIANSLLFLLLGIQISNSHIGAVFGPLLWAIAGVIVGRALMIFLLLTLQNGIAYWYAHRRRSARKRLRSSIMPVPRSWRPIILLSGLRGALSLALVLSLPQGIPNSSLFEFVTYGVVLITLLGQGIAMRAILPRWSRRHEQVDSASAESLSQS
ncbi:MAG TPA: sodium:proton antiporter [Ktedonobacterales bacterium]|jgi:CPA1 family monovalent cation:H+ antiporter|nr:sodium:proton antiporter [Ktedonobacterales bacterium]